MRIEDKKRMINYLHRFYGLLHVSEILNTRSEVFDDMTPAEFAEEAGVDEAMGILVRVYGEPESLTEGKSE